MRPLTLTMTAFGPFPDSETIDFRLLGENPLFLINGPTGAGKTTILDAICFALYGKTTGDEREGGQMRCDLSSADTLTEVRFDFELSGRQYRIVRSPEQQRPKSRGEGFTTQAPVAELKELLSDGEEDLIVPSKVSEATREIEERTGLTVDQFRQVMVLPQGKFRQLLLADSSEREKIFSQLFQTGIYRRLEDNLKARAADVRHKREEQQQRQQGILEGANLESPEALENEMAELTPDSERAAEVKREKEGLFVAADQAFEKGKVLQKQFTYLARVMDESDRLQKKQQQIDVDKDRLKQAELAGKLSPLFNDLERCQKVLNQSLADLEQAKARQKTADLALEDTTKRQPEVLTLQTKRDQVKQTEGQLKGLRTRVDSLNHARQTLQVAKVSVDKSELLLQFKRLADQFLLQHELEQFEKKKRDQEVILQQRRNDEGTLRQSCEKLEQEAKHLELDWHQGQAAILAAELKKGQPCPVCGSVEHPEPAPTDASLPSQHEVEKARQEVRGAFADIEKAKLQTIVEQDRLRELGQQIEKRHEAVVAKMSLADLKQEIRVVQEAATALEYVLPNRDSVPNLDVEQLKKDAQSQQEELAVAEVQVEAAEKELPDDYRRSGALSEAIEHARKNVDELEGQIKVIENAQQEAQIETSAANATAEGVERQWQKDESAWEQARGKWQSELERSQFADDKFFHAALLADGESSALKRAIDRFDADSQRLSGAVQQLQDQLKDSQPPDMDALGKQRQQVEEDKQQADGNWRELDKRMSLLGETRKKLQNAAAESAELDREYAVVGTLSNVANGQTGNKVSLQRFVLSVLLDDVLVEASHRLSLMSKGRYQLLRKEDPSKRNRASGLELEVEDAYTGKVRPVATLSGGESFMAALSLALGLSDVVQAYSGGIRLDTLFIDEGFGSLDAESLDLAIRTLIDLQSSGRTVGIISHVAELKEILSRRIDVSMDRVGSSVRVVTV